MQWKPSVTLATGEAKKESCVQERADGFETSVGDNTREIE